jgi:hypothetical protein
VWGGLRLALTIFLRVAIIVRYRGHGVCELTAFWGTLFQLAVSPFNGIDKVMEDVGRKVGRMLDKETGQDQEKEEPEEPNLEGFKKKYPCWLLGHQEERAATSPGKADLDDTASLFEGKNT